MRRPWRSSGFGGLLAAALLSGCAAGAPCADNPDISCEGPPPAYAAPAYVTPTYAVPAYTAPTYYSVPYASPAYAPYGGAYEAAPAATLGFGGPSVFVWQDQTLPVLYDGNYGWGGWDRYHRWHPAPPDIRDRFARDFPGGRGFGGPPGVPGGFRGGPPGNGFRGGLPPGRAGLPNGAAGLPRPGGFRGPGYGPFTNPVSPGGPPVPPGFSSGPGRGPGAPPAGYGPFTHPGR